MDTTNRRPQWWNNEHDSAWDRTKAAIRRDWEQTKHDLGGGGKDLNQDASDTFAQARGTAPLPPTAVPNVPDEADIKRHAKEAEKEHKKAEKEAEKAVKEELKNWDRSEDAIRYGYGAGVYVDRTRDWPAASADLRREWGSIDERPWDEVEPDIRYGWNNARNSRFNG
jgi:hypothetical protein